MVATTPINGLRMAQLTDAPPSIETAFSQFGADVDTRIIPRFVSATDRDAAITSPTEGMYCYLTGTALGEHQQQFYDGSAWVRVPEVRYKYKTADEIVNNTATVQNDDHLTQAVRANSRYIFDVVLYHQSVSVAPDLRCRFTFPTGATTSVGMHAQSETGTQAPNTTFNGVALTNDAASPTGDFLLGLAVALPTMTIFKGVIETGSTAGSLTLQWAQVTATAENTTVFKWSYMRMERID